MASYALCLLYYYSTLRARRLNGGHVSSHSLIYLQMSHIFLHHTYLVSTRLRQYHDDVPRKKAYSIIEFHH
ncbi:hypothetical protein EDB85DRAFT_1974793 [Lactarius pseudohatsudake]|nr:hypothetical protein EDB85DRAFT_1974793 [Lactarius pseudohatsudake]